MKLSILEGNKRFSDVELGSRLRKSRGDNKKISIIDVRGMYFSIAIIW